jgi:putative tryptophan/tyrosine transport system substrate-binding protein
MLTRRQAIAALAASALLPQRTSFAQQVAQRAARIGVLPLGSSSNAYDVSLVDALRQGLRELGLVENRDIVLDVAWVASESEYPEAVSRLLQRGAVLMVTAGTTASVSTKRHAPTVPMVFTTVGDPMGVGLIESFSRPGGSATGFSDVLLDLSGKYVELAKALGDPQAPVHYLWYTEWANGRKRYEATQAAAQASRVQLRARGIGNMDDAGDALMAMKKAGATALIVQPSPYTYLRRTQLIDLAADQGIGTIFAWPAAAVEGAVVAYGPDYAALYRRAAPYVEKILKGTRPAELPVQQPEKFDLVVNVKAARSLGILVPQSVILRADQVIL